MNNKMCIVSKSLYIMKHRYGKGYIAKFFTICVLCCLFLYVKVEATNNSICYMVTGEQKEIPVSFHGGSYYYHSTNLKVIEFTDTGKMKALKSGDCIVVLTYFDSDNNKVQKKFKVKVHDKVKGFKWIDKRDVLKVGSEYTYRIGYKAKSKKILYLNGVLLILKLHRLIRKVMLQQ